MDTAQLAGIVGFAATTVFMAELIPQPVRLWRTRSVAGLSPIGTGIYFVTELGWVAYGLSTGLLYVLGTALAASLLSGLQLILLWHRRAPNDVWWMALWASGLVGGIVTGTIGIMLVVGLIIGLGPQAWAAWRSVEVHGVSVWRWVFSGTSGLLWCTYGVLVGEFPLIATGSVGMACASLALSRAAGDRLARRALRASDRTEAAVPADTPPGI